MHDAQSSSSRSSSGGGGGGRNGAKQGHGNSKNSGALGLGSPAVVPCTEGGGAGSAAVTVVAQPHALLPAKPCVSAHFLERLQRDVARSSLADCSYSPYADIAKQATGVWVCVCVGGWLGGEGVWV